MAKQSMPSGGGKWAMPSPSSVAPVTSKPKSGISRSPAGANKHANTQPQDYTLASSLSAKNKHHGS